MERSIAAAVLLLLANSALAQTPKERVLLLNALDNGSFSETAVECIPWWIPTGDGVVVKSGALFTPAGTRAVQPVAAYRPLSDGVVIRGHLVGDGAIALHGGDGYTTTFPQPPRGGRPRTFEISMSEGERPPLVPRFSIEFSGDRDGAHWSGLEVLVPLPCPDEPALAAEIAGYLRDICRDWLELAADREGPRATALLPHVFDAVTGDRLSSNPASLHPLFQWLLRARGSFDDERAMAAFDRYVEDYLSLCLHPETGLPRLWDCATDAPLDDRALEVAAHLRFLLDLVEDGPERHREAALAAAKKMGETLLARGVLPDGSVAALYRPKDGEPSTDVVPLRRLDVPAELARLGARTGDLRCRAAARSALAALEYTHYWSGDAHRIDPGFDDDLGHYGARTVVMLEAFPEDDLFRRFAVGGFERYADDWRDSSRCGGSVAADEVRSWELLADLARLEPAILERLKPLVDAAVRAHFKGEQYGNGAWGDVTFVGFEPMVDLAVGDLPGLPANLLKGLAVAYDADLGLRTDEMRARFTAVLRSTVETYRRKRGFLSTVHEMPGHNPAIGSMRLLPGLVGMLERLSARSSRPR